MAANITSINFVALIISIVSLALLIGLKFLNDRFKKQLRNIPIPIELIVVMFLYVLPLEIKPFAT
jgi:hypothetical protein